MTARFLDLQTAVRELRSGYQDLSLGHPFFFVVGAGVSVPSVPLAKQIIAHCKVHDAHIRHRSKSKVGDILDEYSYWFDRAYPQPVSRQRYLRGLIQNKPVPDGCLRLAHLLTSRRVTDLVVTPNFDDFVARALTLFATPHTVCDHPDTVDRVDLRGEDINIVHVHGSYKFYDCRNLREELEDRARPSPRTTRTMAAFLDRVLSFRSPIVLGYSGWNGDVIMSAIQRRIEGTSLPYRLYWFAYSMDDVTDLETRVPWLTEHPDVRIIVPDTVPMETDTAAASLNDSRTLSAQAVLEEISRQFVIEQPEITRDPVGFFARHMRTTLLNENGLEGNLGLYSFAQVVARLERAAELEHADFINKSAFPGIEVVRRLLRESQYTQALESASALIDKATDPERREMYELLRIPAGRVQLAPEQEIAAMELLLRLGEQSFEISQTSEFAGQRAEQRLRLGEALFQQGKFEEALLVFDRLITFPKPGPGEDTYYVKSRKALILAALDRTEEALQILDEILPWLREHNPNGVLTVQSEFNRAVYLRQIRKHEDALRSFQEFDVEYAGATDVWSQLLVISALENAASLSKQLGNMLEARRFLEVAVDRYRRTDNQQIANSVARCALSLMQIFATMGNIQGAWAAYEVIMSLRKDHPLSTDIVNSARQLRRQSVNPPRNE